jgi:hypothetical protein
MKPVVINITRPPEDSTENLFLMDALMLAAAGLPVPRRYVGEITPTKVFETYVDRRFLFDPYSTYRPVHISRELALSMDLTDRVVILSGNEARIAFATRMAPAGWWEWACPGVGDDARMYVCIPSPSPRNRMYNYRKHREASGEVLRRALEAT